jgi:hypothetical protein
MGRCRLARSCRVSGVRRRIRRFSLVCVFLLAVAPGCGSSDAPLSPSTNLAALPSSDRTHAARAEFFAAEVARFRALAAKERAMAAVYAAWTPAPDGRVTTNWNEKMKARSERLAAAADRMAAEVRKVADFHTAEATRLGGAAGQGGGR